MQLIKHHQGFKAGDQVMLHHPTGIRAAIVTLIKPGGKGLGVVQKTPLAEAIRKAVAHA